MLFSSHAISLVVLVLGFVVLVYSVLSFAHIRVNSADMESLQRLRCEGVIPSDVHLISDYREVRRRIAHVAPAIYMRQEPWLVGYYYAVRIALALHPRSGWFNRELLHLSAYQAVRYGIAMERLRQLQYPSF